jgi:hypothetical protein
MLFALSELRFPQENIIVFGWSIGGFTATWLGMKDFATQDSSRSEN